MSTAPSFFTGHRMVSLCLLFFLATGVAQCSLPPGNQANWFVSTQGSDANDCHYLLLPCRHINAVIQRAQAGDTINIGAGTFNESLTVTKSLTLSGQGAAKTFVEGLSGGPALVVGGYTASSYNPTGGLILRVSNVSFKGGNAASAPSTILPGAGGGVFIGYGSVSMTDVDVEANHALNCGGIANQAVLTLVRVSVANNSTSSTGVTAGGGGICNWGTLTITDSTVAGNQTPANGGGIYNVDSLSLLRSTISSNQAGMAGGGLLSATGSLNVSDSSVSGNQALLGGGVALDNNDQAKLERDTLAGNHAQTVGGAIANMHGTSLSLTNVTLSGNRASAGGGIASGNFDEPAFPVSPSDPSLTAVFVTIAFNQAGPSSGGGLYHMAGPATFIDSLFADNTGSSCSGAVTGNGNLTTDATCSFGGPKNLYNVADPRIGPLQDNGGNLLTHALLPGSPAIDAGVVTGVAIPSQDERGKARPDSDENGANLVDIGAYESDGSEATPVTPSQPAQSSPPTATTPTPSVPTLSSLPTSTLTISTATLPAIQTFTPATSVPTVPTFQTFTPATSIPTLSLPTSVSCLLYTSKAACNANPACQWGSLIPVCTNK